MGQIKQIVLTLILFIAPNVFAESYFWDTAQDRSPLHELYRIQYQIKSSLKPLQNKLLNAVSLKSTSELHQKDFETLTEMFSDNREMIYKRVIKLLSKKETHFAYTIFNNESYPVYKLVISLLEELQNDFGYQIPPLQLLNNGNNQGGQTNQMVVDEVFSTRADENHLLTRAYSFYPYDLGFKILDYLGERALEEKPNNLLKAYFYWNKAADFKLGLHSLSAHSKKTFLEKLENTRNALGAEVENIGEDVCFDGYFDILLNTSVDSKNELQSILLKKLKAIDKSRFYNAIAQELVKNTEKNINLATIIHEIGPEIIPKLMQGFALSRDSEIIENLVPVFKKFDPLSVLPQLRDFLNHPDDALRGNAIFLLGQLGEISKPMLSQIIEIFKNPNSDASLRTEALVAISRIGISNTEMRQFIHVELDSKKI